jgi:hypothetical protein
MRSYKSGITCLLAALLVFFIAGCGQETVTIPGVVSVTPAQGATGVAITTTVTATFNMAMSPATINAGTFTVAGPGGAITGAVTYSGLTATFTPSPSLAYGTTYTATITTGAATPGGAELVSDYVWTFTTAAAPLPPAPTVTSTNPANAATGVPLNQVVIATFSEPMAPDTIIGANFALTVTTGGAAVSGSVSYVETAGNAYELVFQLSPDEFLQPSTMYTATISTGVTDVAGTPLNGGIACGSASANGNCVWQFTTTAVGTNNTQPMLVYTYPVNGALDVCVSPAISATFSQAMNPATFTTTTFALYSGTSASGTPIAGTYSQDTTGTIETFTPTNPLTAGDSYTATVTDGATNMAGIGLLVNATGPPPNPWTFTLGTSACPSPVNLGVLAPFGGFGGSAGMTNMGTATVINGDIGTTAAASVMTGFHDDYVLPVISAAGSTMGCTYSETLSNIGLVIAQPVTTPPGIAIFTAPGPPTITCPNEGTGTPSTGTYGIATAALAQALATYNSLQSITNTAVSPVVTDPTAPQGPTTLVTGVDLGGMTLYPGVYWAASTVDITSGDLTLDAQGDPTATFVFQIGSALTVGEAGYARNIILAHGANASNIFWLCATAATINGTGGGIFNGTVIAAEGAISTGTNSASPTTTINGRLISLSASTTLANTIINVPAQ